MRQLLVQVPRGKGKDVLDIARRHDGMNIARWEAEGSDGPSDLVMIHMGNSRVEDLLEASGIGGWTMVRDVAGMGHSGFHQGKTIFNDQTGLVMFVGVGPREKIAHAAQKLGAIFQRKAGVLFLSDVEVIRSDYFVTA